MRARIGFVGLSLAALAAVATIAAGGEGTRTDPRTGLVWVADPHYAVTHGVAAEVSMPRARAARMVAAMNAGRLPNHGRRDWRLANERELARWLRRQGLAGERPPARNQVRAWPVAGAATLPGVDGVAVLATNSVKLEHHAEVVGGVVVNEVSPGPTLDPAGELKLDHHAEVEGDVAADSVRLDHHARVDGDAAANSLSSSGTITGATTSPLALPVFALLPPFHTAAPRADAPDVTVPARGEATLAAGEYDDVEVGERGKLVLTGGTYELRSVRLRDRASVELLAPSELRIAQRLELAARSVLAPRPGATATPGEVVVYVNGVDGTTGALGAMPPAALVGRDSVVGANLYAPHGSVVVDMHTVVRGSLLARDVRIAAHARVELESFYVNRPPIAQPAIVTTGGTAAVTVTLRGSDPDGDDLTFAIAAAPAHGTLGPVVEQPPPLEPGDPERPQGDPPRTSATVAYTPTGAGDLEDAFAFRVTDPSGASGTATITINPPAQEDPPPPDPTTVVVSDVAETTLVDRPVTVTLLGGAPAGVAISFSLLPATGPASGSLGPLMQGNETPQRSATVVYTPAAGFTGVESFQFEACGVIAAATACDVGTATVETTPATPEPVPELAPDQSVSTPQGAAVAIGLGGVGSAAGEGSSAGMGALRRIAGKAVAFAPAAVGGNVADADGDGFGDNHNSALASGTPVLVAAGVGLSGGPGSNGTVRLHLEWDVSGLGSLGPDASARVLLTTNRGTLDSLPTRFFAGVHGNGRLEDGDFEASLELLPGAVMPVSGAVGADGTFIFDVKDALAGALAAGATHFTVQGRVDESLAAGRGLQVYSTADNPLTAGKVPGLLLSTPPPLPPPTFILLSLPAHGTLRDALGNAISDVPHELAGAVVTYVPATGFLGADAFRYRAVLGETSDEGLVSVFVNLLDCDTSAAGCDDGR
jgi:cytoskeletal protein CcmA (bactofilin family)